MGALARVDSKGKHLFIRFRATSPPLALRMNGWWGVYERGRRWGKSPSRAWLVIRTDRHEVVQFGGPVLELMTDSRSRFDHRSPGSTRHPGRRVRRCRVSCAACARTIPRAGSGRAARPAHLADRQPLEFGGCFLAGIDPWRPVSEVSDEDALRAVLAVRPLMLRSGQGGHGAMNWSSSARPPCRHCGTRIRARGQATTTARPTGAQRARANPGRTQGR